MAPRCHPAARALLVIALPLFSAGCGGDDVAPVSGQVTINGKPAADVRVIFQPLGSKENPTPGRGSYGKTDADGRYHLALVGKEQSGAFVGPHRVELRAPVSGTMKIPKEYNYESKLRCDVPKGGTTTADFDVKTR
jgi:hypothetical protein